MIEQVIVGATGLGYLIVGVLQWAKKMLIMYLLQPHTLSCSKEQFQH